jgi:RecA/RadA recombinase
MAEKKEIPDELSYSEQVPPIIDPSHWISTGSVALDAAIGRGYPKKRITHIYGPSQSRKTTLMLSMLSKAQSTGLRSSYYTSEPGSLLEEMAIYFGMDLGALRYKEIDTVEEFFDRGWKFSTRCTNDKVSGLIALDSMSGLSCNAELYAPVRQDFHFPPHTRKIAQGWRVFSKTMVKNGTTAIVIDHQKATGVPGGAATGFFASVQLRMEGLYPIRENNAEDGKEIGFASNIHITKCRTGLKRSLIFRFLYKTNPIIEHLDWWTFLTMNEIAVEAGSWYKIPKYVDKSFYKKDFSEVYEKHKNLWPTVLEEYYQRRYKEYCNLRGIDPKKHMDTYVKSLEAEANRPIAGEEVIMQAMVSSSSTE